MSIGPIMLDLQGLEPDSGERELLLHPAVGGVILFSRNYAEPRQLRALVDAVHAVREPRLLVAVDQEGGRVQRFRREFTRLPAPASLGRRFDRDRRGALSLAETCGWVLAAELRALGVDFSFSPVLDLDRACSTVIGDRALHRDPEVVAELGRAVVRGMGRAGMAAVGKHFPGHGAVAEDSHLSVPVDKRPVASIRLEDMLVFERLIHYGLPAVMPAHVIYPALDSKPAGFSAAWLQRVLREELAFQGAVFSDDISMAGAAVAGDLGERAGAALRAGCDMVLVCNDRAGAERVLERLEWQPHPLSTARLARMRGRGTLQREELLVSTEYRNASRLVAARDPELDLGDDAPL